MSKSCKLVIFLAVLLQLFVAPSASVFADSIQKVAAADPVYVTAKLIADVDKVKAGKSFRLGVQLKMVPGWHTYYKESGDAGLPTKIEWKLPPGFKAGELQWTKPQKFDDAGIVTYGYQDYTMIGAEITPPATLKDGETLKIDALVKWLSCKDICLPGKAEVSLQIPVGSVSHPVETAEFAKLGYKGNIKELPDAEHKTNANSSSEKSSSSGGGGSVQSQFGASSSVLDTNFQVQGSSTQSMSLLTYIGCALLGGLILNVMPCVLPVIAIKVLSFMEQADEDPARVRLLGLTFSAGIVSSFMALAAIVIAVQATGRQVGWGFLFAQPGFVVAMCAVVLLFALSLFGLFYVQVSASSTIDNLASREGYSGTFFKGVLATILSTPCTAPFLGTALGFAFVQPWWVVALIFFAAGLGMTSPYLVLSMKPEWMKFIPKPGVWMEKIKESLGFILLATVAWLLGLLGGQMGTGAIIDVTYFLVALSFAAWLVSRFTDLTSTTNRKAVVWSIAVLITGLSFYLFVWSLPGIGGGAINKPASTEKASGDNLTWVPFSVDALNNELRGGKTVLLDFTADWCLTCKVNEQTVLESQPVKDKIRKQNVVTMRADWTLQDKPTTDLLRKFNRSGVPLYVVFPAGHATEPIVLPEVITQQLVLDALDQAAKTK